jgi:phage baseplate assembly protein gpV
MRTGELYQRYFGIYLGRVVDNVDPEGLGRVRVRMQQFEDSDDEPVFASVARPVANDETTVFFTPQEGDQVVVGFLVGDVNEPIILGYAHSEKKRPPSEVSAPSVHGVVSKIGRVTFDEQAGKIEVVFNTPRSSLTMDATGVKIQSDLQILLESKVAVNLAAPAIGFAGQPSFIPFGTPLPQEPPAVAQMVFSGGVEVATGNGTFCIDTHRVVLDTFVSDVFAKHIHVSGPPTGPTSVPLPAFGSPPSPPPGVSVGIPEPPGALTSC